MAFKYFDRVQETSATTGTGTITLGGAVTGYVAFTSVFADGDTMFYCITDQSGPNWEVGLGTFTAAGTLLARSVIASSNANALVNFTSGALYVFNDVPARGLAQSMPAVASQWLKSYDATTGLHTQSQPTVTDIVGLSSFYFGTGQDGNVTINSGTTTLTRDMFYNNLTISGTGILRPNGFRIFIAGIFDISAAPAGALVYVGGNGINAVGASAGGATSMPVGTNSTVTQQGAPSGGGAGGINNGTGGGGGGTVPALNAISGSQAGAGGAGGTGTAGGGGGPTTTSQYSFPYKYNDLLPRVALGTPGSGGGGGGGDATNSGGGGGSAATGGGNIVICANTIARGANVNAALITSIGGRGGNGAAGVAGNAGGGGGGSGGQGGNIFIFYATLTGSAITNAIDVTGGAGGNGGALVGTGANGNGGGAGSGGYVLLSNLTTGVLTEFKGAAAVARQTGGVTAGVAATASQTTL